MKFMVIEVRREKEECVIQEDEYQVFFRMIRVEKQKFQLFTKISLENVFGSYLAFKECILIAK